MFILLAKNTVRKDLIAVLKEQLSDLSFEVITELFQLLPEEVMVSLLAAPMFHEGSVLERLLSHWWRDGCDTFVGFLAQKLSPSNLVKVLLSGEEGFWLTPMYHILGKEHLCKAFCSVVSDTKTLRKLIAPIGGSTGISSLATAFYRRGCLRGFSVVDDDAVGNEGLSAETERGGEGFLPLDNFSQLIKNVDLFLRPFWKSGLLFDDLKSDDVLRHGVMSMSRGLGDLCTKYRNKVNGDTIFHYAMRRAAYGNDTELLGALIRLLPLDFCVEFFKIENKNGETPFDVIKDTLPMVVVKTLFERFGGARERLVQMLLKRNRSGSCPLFRLDWWEIHAYLGEKKFIEFIDQRPGRLGVSRPDRMALHFLDIMDVSVLDIIAVYSKKAPVKKLLNVIRDEKQRERLLKRCDSVVQHMKQQRIEKCFERECTEDERFDNLLQVLKREMDREKKLDTFSEKAFAAVLARNAALRKTQLYHVGTLAVPTLCALIRFGADRFTNAFGHVALNGLVSAVDTFVGNKAFSNSGSFWAKQAYLGALSVYACMQKSPMPQSGWSFWRRG